MDSKKLFINKYQPETLDDFGIDQQIIDIF